MSAPGDPLVRFQTLDEFLQPPTLSTQIRGLTSGGEIVLIFGPPKGGKTFTVCDLTMHAAHGMDWHGFKIPKRLSVAYLCGEGARGLKVRLHAWLMHHDSIETPGRFWVLPQALSLPAHVDEIVRALDVYMPDILVTDTLNAFFGAGNENDTEDMTRFVATLRRMKEALGASVFVIHHTPVADASRSRGAGALIASADVVAQVAKDENGSGNIGFQIISGRDIEPMDTPLALRLRRVDTDWTDSDGLPLTTCVIEGADVPVQLAGRGGRALGDSQKIIVDVVTEMAAAGTPDSTGQVLIARPDIIAAATRRGASRPAAYKAIAQLASRMHWRLVEPGGLYVRPRA